MKSQILGLFSENLAQKHRIGVQEYGPGVFFFFPFESGAPSWLQFPTHLTYIIVDILNTDTRPYWSGLPWVLCHTVEKAMATHSSTLAWKIPRTEESGRLQFMGSLRVRHDWATSLSLFTLMHWRRKWQPTSVFLPGESRGLGGLVGWGLWGRTESDMTEATQQQHAIQAFPEVTTPYQCFKSKEKWNSQHLARGEIKGLYS